MMSTKQTGVIAIIALMVGVICGGILMPNPIETELSDTSIIDLEDTILELDEANKLLIDELELTITNLHISYQANITILEQKHDKLKNDYELLLDTHNTVDIKNASRIETFVLLPGDTFRYDYDV